MNLYAAASVLRQLNPWEFMDPADLFGIQNPKTGETVYISFHDNEDDRPKMVLYRGNRGLRMCRRLTSNEVGLLDDEMVFGQDGFEIDWLEPSKLESADRKLVQGLKKQGLSFKKADGTPQFRSLIPYYAAWYLTESEAEFLTLCLERAAFFVRSYEEDRSLLDAEAPESILVDCATPFETGMRWDLQWKTPITQPSALDAEYPLVPNELQLKRIKKAKMKVTSDAWEADCFVIPGVEDDRDRPYVARTTLIADRMKGEPVNSQMIPPEVSAHQAICQDILNTIEEKRLIPARICVSDAELQKKLHPIASDLGTQILYRLNLPLTTMLKDFLYADFGGDPMDDEDLDLLLDSEA